MTKRLDTPDSVLNPISDWLLEEAAATDEGTWDLIAGLANLCAHLTVHLEKVIGLTASEILDGVAQKYR
jgi:hypothetical protein